MRFVLEEEQPILVLAVHVDLHLHRAGVYLLRLVEALQDALGFQVLRPDRAHIHKAEGPILASELAADGQIPLEGPLHGLVVYLHVRELRAEGGMATVVGPVGVYHLDFGDGGAAPLFREVTLAEGDIRQVHGQTALLDEGGQLLFGEGEEPLDDLYGRGSRVGGLQRFGLLE